MQTVDSKSSSRSGSASARLNRSFNLSKETGVPKHLETIGHRAAAKQAHIESARRPASAKASTESGSGGSGAGGGLRVRVNSAGQRYDPVGSRPRYTFSAPPGMFDSKKLCYAL
jgi:hypothetical protein